jgi:uncharacterized SAM-binding protein YcdF (DUF218 family)
LAGVTNWLINFFGPLFHPLGLVWSALLVLGAANLARKNRSGGLALLGVWALMTAVGSTPLPEFLVASLERPFLGKTVSAAKPGDAVLMLGGAVHFSPNDAFRLGFSEAAPRVVTAVEAVRQHKGSALVLGGGGYRQDGRDEPESALLRNFLQSWKVCDAPIYALGVCQNTHDEALAFQKLARAHGWRRIVLVTSAAHLRRASGLFRQIGLPIEVVACDFRAVGVQRPFRSIFPGTEGFELLDIYLHETIGWHGYRWRGWVRD